MSFLKILQEQDLISIFKAGFENNKYFLNSNDNKIWNTEEYEAERRGLIPYPIA